MTYNFKKHIQISNGNSYTFPNVLHHFYNFKKRVIMYLLMTKLKPPLIHPIHLAFSPQRVRTSPSAATVIWFLSWALS